jgi:signal transduction histidine kinase
MNAEDSEREEIRQRARLEERHRLALYLHDSIGQTLCTAKLQLTRIQAALRQPLDPATQAWVQTTIEGLNPELDTTMQAIRDKLVDLDVAALTELDLTATLEHECAGFMRRTGIPCARRVESLDVDAHDAP